MTLIAVGFYVLTGVSAAALLMFGVPALLRESFQSRMSDLAQDVDDHIRTGSLPHHAHVLEIRTMAYYFAERPEAARLLDAVRIIMRARTEGVPSDPSYEAFRGTATPAEMYIAEEIRGEIVLAVVRQSFRNSIAWLPLAVALPIVLRTSSSIRRTQALLARPDRHTPEFALSH